MEKFAQPGKGGGCTPTPSTISTIMYNVVVYAPAQRAYIPHISILPLHVLCGYHSPLQIVMAVWRTPILKNSYRPKGVMMAVLAMSLACMGIW